MSLRRDPNFYAEAGPLLAAAAAIPPPAIHDIATRRAGLAAGLVARTAFISRPTNVQTTEYKISSHDGVEISVYHVRCTDAPSRPGPALIHAHGGGMIATSVKEFAPLVARQVSTTGVPVFDVEYRLAPEHRHPSLVEDVYAALVWLHAHATDFNIDPARIGIWGESAGGGIAAGVALLARDRHLSPPLAKQILFYPMLDSRTLTASPTLTSLLASWTVESNITGWTALLGENYDPATTSPYASPSHAADLSGLPPTYIDVGALDLFRDEDIEYAGRLAKVDNDVELHVYPGVPHAFDLWAPNCEIVQTATANRIRAVMLI